MRNLYQSLTVQFLFFIFNFSNGHPPEKVYIGGLFPISSTVSGVKDFSGSMYLAAALMALREINNKHDLIHDELLPNTTLLFAVRSPRRDYIYGIKRSLELASSVFNGRGISACVGPVANSPSQSSADIFTQYEIVQITYGANSSIFGSKSNFPYLTRGCTSEATEGRSIANMIVTKFSWGRVTVFFSSDAYGSNNFFEFNAEAQRLGQLSIASSHQFANGQNDFTDIISTAKTARTTIFVLFGNVKSVSKLLEQGYKANLFRRGTQIFGGSLASVPSLWSQMVDQSSVPDVMRGFIGLSLAFNTTAPGRTSFIHRWRSQPDTVTISNGVRTCPNNTTDDDGGYFLYQDHPNANLSLPMQCTGLQFSAFQQDGSDIDPYVYYTYDSLYAIARAIHILLYDMKRSSVVGSELINVLINNVSFVGLTGPFSFNQGDSNSDDRYGRGDRISGIQYNVLNFHPDVYLSSAGADSGLVQVGLWSSESGFNVISGSAPFVFNTDDNRPPPDMPPKIPQRMPVGMKIAVWLAGSLCLALALALFVFVIYNIRTGVMKAGQPVMLIIVLIGAGLGGGRVINAGSDVSDATCLLGTFLGHLCFVLVFSSLCVKTWRVHKLTNSKMRRVRVTTKAVIEITAACIAVALVYLLVMMAVSPPKLSYLTVEADTSSLLYFKCSQSIPMMTSVLYVVECMSLLYGTRLCWATRKVPDAINESKYIATGAYDYAILSIK